MSESRTRSLFETVPQGSPAPLQTEKRVTRANKTNAPRAEVRGAF